MNHRRFSPAARISACLMLAAFVAVPAMAAPSGAKPGKNKAAISKKDAKERKERQGQARKEKQEKKEDLSLKPRPVDAVQAEISRKHKSKRARGLKLAYEALQAKQFAKAAKLAEGDGEFADYGYWIAAQAKFGSAKAALEAKRYGEAVKAAEGSVASTLRIEARAPYSPMYKFVARDAGLAEVLIGDAQAASRKWAAAVASFDRGFQRLTIGNSLNLVRPDSLLRYAEACAQKESELCLAWIGRFASIYPKSSPEMQAVLKVLPNAADRPKPAHHGKTSQNYKAPDLDQAAFEANLALYLDGKFGDAIKGFRQFADEFPKSPYRFRARYWLAQAFTHEQDHDKARKAYEELQKDSPLTYYGLLAAFAAGTSMDAPVQPVVPLAAERDPLLLPIEVIRVQRAEKFIAEGARELAALELKELKARDALSNPFLMYLAVLNAEAGTHSTAFTLLGELIGRGYEGATSLGFINLVFPAAHFELIRKHAEAANLDPILVLSLIKQESAFDPGAGSNVGATGLMQLMPATATDTDPTVERADLIDPDTNIRVGTKYLRQVLNKFNGNIVLALAGYNAGPHAVDRWLRESANKGRDHGMLEFIETIPYRETREYVGSIIRNYYWYSRKLAAAEPAKPLNYFWGASASAQKTAPSPTPEPSPASSLEAVPTEPVTVPRSASSP